MSNMGQLLDSSYMALDILCRQGRIIDKAGHRVDAVQEQTGYSESILGVLRSSWRWLFGVPSSPSGERSGPRDERSGPQSIPSDDLKTILELQRAIGATLDKQMGSLIKLDEDTDTVLNCVLNNNDKIRTI